MKRKKENLGDKTACSGLTITDSISLTFNSRNRMNSKLLLLLTAMAGIAGFTVSFLSLFSFECSYRTIYTAEALMFAVSSVLCFFPSKAKLLHIPIYGLMAYYIYSIQTEFSYGYAQFINVIAEKLKITAPGLPYYKIPEDNDIPHCLTLFLVILFMIITTVICFNTIVKPRFITVFACTFPFIETGLMFGFSPDHTAFSLLISYWIALFSMRVVGNQYHSAAGKPVFVRKNNIFVSSGNLRNNVIEDIGIITLVSVFSLFLITGGIVNIFNVSRPQKVNDTRREIKTAVSDLSVEKLANRVYEEAELSPVTEKSQLGNLAKITYLDKTDLTIFLSDKPQNILYLKGFVGSEYSNNTWYSISEETVQNNHELFDSFGTSGVYPQFFNYYNDYALSQIYPDKIKKCHIIINSWFKNNRYAFAAYNTSGSENLRPENDTFLRADNLNSYSYDMFITPDYFKNTNIILSNTEKLSDNVKETEKKYREFVYGNYLYVPESDTMTQLAEEYGYIPDYNGKNISDIYKCIKDILHSSSEYTLEPGRTPSDTELTWYFLKENHKGYCSHFATSAVVLARLNGVPARYIEGYVVVPSDFTSAESVNSFYKIDVKDSRAHAWAEFYIDGYGWVPFEFTPGYDTGIISAELSSGDNSAPEAEVAVTEEIQQAEPEIITEIAVVTEPDTSQLYGGGDETAPAETEAAQDETDMTSDSPDHTETPEIRKGISRFVLVILLIAVMIILAVSSVFAVHVITVGKRNRSFRCGSNNESLTNVYRYMLVLLDHTGIRKKNMLPLEFAEYAEKNVRGALDKYTLKDDEIRRFITLTLKAGYSGEQITDEELRNSVRTVNALAACIYKNKNKRDKFIFRFIQNLYR